MIVEYDNGLRIEVTGGDDAVDEQALLMSEALHIYMNRNVKYKDNWQRFGWRGCLFRLRERVERLWDMYWDAEPEQYADVDDAIDMINFACFVIRAIRSGDRDGSWF